MLNLLSRIRPHKEEIDYKALAFEVTRSDHSLQVDAKDRSLRAQYIRAAQKFVAGELTVSCEAFLTLARRNKLIPAFIAASRVANQMLQHEKAEQIVREALSSGKNFDLLMELAAAQYLQGKVTDANGSLDQAKNLNPAYFSDLAAETIPLQNELKVAMETGALYRPHESDKYDSDEYVTTYWQSCHAEFITRNRRQTPHALAYELMLTEIAEVIGVLKPSGFLDFGCACGLPLDHLAKRFPDVSFGGIDRQPVLKKLNEERYTRANLSFADGDVLDFIPTFMPGQEGKMLCHIRTGIMVYPAYMERVYAACRENGFNHVVLYEVASLSAESARFRSEGEIRSEIHRSIMFLHDYPGMLRDAGFSNVSIRPMPHGHGFLFNNMLPGDTYRLIIASV